MVLAAAAAPGCGGIKQCTEYNPVAREVDIMIAEMPVRLLNDLIEAVKYIYILNRKKWVTLQSTRLCS